MGDRYRATEISLASSRTAAVIDDCRDGEVFCVIPARTCCNGNVDVALARAKDIADTFNRTRREDAPKAA